VFDLRRGSITFGSFDASISEQDDMHPFRLAMLVAGVVLVAFATFAAKRVFAGSVEPAILESENGSLVSCNSEDVVVSAPANESPCQTHAREAGETARARAYLIATSSPGYTMTRQGPERRHRAAAPGIRQSVGCGNCCGARSRVAIRRNFLGLSAACIRRRRLYRQVPLASHLWARRRHYRDRRTRHAKRFALARDRGAARCDLPIRAPQPGGMEPLPADADKNHFVREPAARNSHSGRTHQSRRHVRSRQFAHRGFERCKRTDGGTARAFFQAASAAHAARRAADYCRANNFPAQVSWLLGRSARWRSIRDQRSCHLPTTFEKTSCYPWRLSACLYPYISRRKYWGSLASGSHRGEQSRRC
jgi:hypothetical protein